MNTKKDSRGRNLKQGENQMSDGRYRYRYTDKYGKRQATYAWKLVPTDKTPSGKKEDLSLREKELQILKDMDENINAHDAEITVSELVEKYLKTKAGLKDTTINNYYRMKELHIDTDILGKTKIGKVRKSNIKEYYVRLYTGDGKGSGLSNGTIQLYQNLLFPAFQMAVEDSIIRLNPCAGCMTEYSTGGLASNKIPLTAKEQSRLLEFVKNDAFYNDKFCLIATILATGCRIGEALGLTWNDIDFEKGCVSITHQMIYKEKIRGEAMRYFIEVPKNKTSREIPIQEDITKLLQKHKEETYFISKASDFVVDGLTDFIFLNKNGRVVTPGSVNRSFRGIAEAINKKEALQAIEENREPEPFPHFSAHTLRHTFCTRMAENGCDIKVLQDIMGHKNISVTMQVYNHTNFERNKKVVSNVMPVLGIAI